MPAPRNVLVLVNPISGQGQGRKSVGPIHRVLAERGVRAEVALLPGPGLAGEIVAEWAGKVDAVIGVGGDGTIAEAAGAVYQYAPATPLGLIPLGLSNCLARHHRIPFDLEKAADIIAAGKTAPIDLADIHGRTALSFIGAGFDASVVDKVAGARKGAVNDGVYVRAAFKTVFKEKWARLNVEIDGRTIEGPFYQVIISAVTNYAHYFPLPDTGGFTAYLFRGRHAGHALKTLLKSGPQRDLARGADVTAPVRSNIRVTSEEGRGYWQYDGEAGGALPLDCRIAASALAFFVP